MRGRVLVVDDEADLVGSYERLLRRQGYRVVATGTLREALTSIAGGNLVLVVADLRLPDGDGLELVRAARRPPAPIPVIVVTGFGSEASRDAALGAGASAYLRKPFSASAFASLVDQAASTGRTA